MNWPLANLCLKVNLHKRNDLDDQVDELFIKNKPPRSLACTWSTSVRLKSSLSKYKFFWN